MHLYDYVLRTKSYLKENWDNLWNAVYESKNYNKLSCWLNVDISEIFKAASCATRDGYKIYEIPKRRGYRTIFEPYSDLRKVQKKIYEKLSDIYKPHNSAHGFVKNLSTVTHANIHRGKKYIVCIDIKNFFSSTTHLHLESALKKHLNLDPEIRRTLIYIATIPFPTQRASYYKTNLGIINNILKQHVSNLLQLKNTIQDEFLNAFKSNDRFNKFLPPVDAIKESIINSIQNSRYKSLLGLSEINKNDQLLNDFFNFIEKINIMNKFLSFERINSDRFFLNHKEAINILNLIGINIKGYVKINGSFLKILKIETRNHFKINNPFLKILRHFPWLRESSHHSHLRQLSFSTLFDLSSNQHKSVNIGTSKKFKNLYLESLGWRVLPQGSPCSPILANIAAHDLDEKMYNLSKEYELSYSRYADDLVFSSNKKISKKIVQKVAHLLESEGYRIHREKTQFRGPGQQKIVTGVVIGESQLHADKISVRTMRAILHNLDKNLRGDRSKPVKILKKELKMVDNALEIREQEKLRGHLSYIRMINKEDYNKLVQKSQWARDQGLIFEK